MSEAWIEEQLREAAGTLGRLAGEERHARALYRICEAVLRCLGSGGKILTMGNGGSAADALHLAEELLGRYRGDRPSCAAVCISSDATALTCIANDYGFERIFVRQIEALARPGDVAIGFSTSGNSKNVNLALRAARERGATTVGLLGRDGGEAAGLCDHAFVVPSANSARIQEAHSVALHVICEAVERRYVDKKD